MKEATIRKRLGRIVRKKREELDLTQEELAELADIHRNHISAVERCVSSPTVDMVVKIAKALNLSASDLLSEAGL